MSDELRNQVSVVLGGKERTMRATFGAMRGIEQALGESIISTMARARTIGVNDCAVIIYHGLRGFGDTRGLDDDKPNGLTFEAVGEAVIQEGLGAVGVPCMKFLGLAMNGVKAGKSEEAAQ